MSVCSVSEDSGNRWPISELGFGFFFLSLSLLFFQVLKRFRAILYLCKISSQDNIVLSARHGVGDTPPPFCSQPQQVASQAWAEALLDFPVDLMQDW